MGIRSEVLGHLDQGKIYISMIDIVILLDLLWENDKIASFDDYILQFLTPKFHLVSLNTQS